MVLCSWDSDSDIRVQHVAYAVDTEFWIIEFRLPQEPGTMVARNRREFLDFLNRLQGVCKIPPSLLEPAEIESSQVARVQLQGRK